MQYIRWRINENRSPRNNKENLIITSRLEFGILNIGYINNVDYNKGHPSLGRNLIGKNEYCIRPISKVLAIANKGKTNGIYVAKP